MPQPKLPAFVFALCSALLGSALLVAAPASAQVDPIFQDEVPRPPGDVPGTLGPPPYPGQIAPRPVPPPPGYRRPFPPPPADIGNDAIYDESDDAPDGPDDETDEFDDDNAGPGRPVPPPGILPPPNQPRGRTFESQDLAPPPGTPPAPGVAGQPRGREGGQAVQDGAREQGNGPPALPPREQQGGDPSVPTDTVVVAPPPQRIANPTAVFAGLDKITGRIISFDVAIDETVQFGALQVTPRACYSRPPTERANTDAFIEVEEETLKGEIKRIFTGWMFAASPGLHAVEHPIYDVWLTDCKGAQTATAERANDQNDKRRPTARVPQPPPRPQRP